MEIQAVKRRISALKGDWEAAARILGEKDTFAMTVDGVLYTERKEAGLALLAACAGIGASRVPVQVGTFQGFRLSVSFDSFNRQYLMTIGREWNYRMEMGKDSLGNLKRLQNLLAGIEGEIPKAERKLESLNRQLAAAREEVEKPFPKEEELAGMLKRLAELNTMLNMDQREETGASDEREEEAEESDREDAAADKRPETVRKEEPWTLEKIKEMKKQRQGGTEAVRHSGKHRENGGMGRG